MQTWVGEALFPGFREEYLREFFCAEGHAGLDTDQCTTCADVLVLSIQPMLC